VTDSLHREEFLAGYVAEAHDHLAAARRALVSVEEALRRDQAAPRAARELFRALHTLKGLSGMIGVEAVVDLAHEMEAIVRAADRAGGRLAPNALDALVQGTAAIEDRVERVARREPVPAAPQALLVAFSTLSTALPQAPPRSLDLADDLAAKLGPAELEQLGEGLAAGRRAVRIEFVPSPERAARGLDITAARERVDRLGEIVKVLPRGAAKSDHAPAGLVFVLLVLTSAPDEELAAAVESPADAVREIHARQDAPPPLGEDESEGWSPAAPAFVRVDVARLDEALERISALIVSRARLVRAVEGVSASGADVRPLAPILQDHARDLRMLRAAVMRARMVRLSEVLERAPLLVRGLARSGDKQVRLDLDVGQAEVDKAVGERLFPAIVHLVRNAVDHAIEAPRERRALGKREEGIIRIASAHRGEGRLEITVSDDGRGIDLEAVARKAGAPVPSTGPEILDLIAAPGLSTLETPTRTSGRGIGMDVVRRTVVSDLGGSLDVSTARGLGTTFTLRVPLSLTIVDGLTLECAGEIYVVPTASVDELVEVDPAGLVAGPGAFRAGAPVRMLRWRGESVPYVELRDALGLHRGGAGRKGLVVRADGVSFAFGVDRMIGRQEVVIRPMSDPLVDLAGIAGATDLGDGKPTLVLDLPALTRTLAPSPAPRGVA
jgi:two-component system chemotaxis sensor kinase CheA